VVINERMNAQMIFWPQFCGQIFQLTFWGASFAVDVDEVSQGITSK